MLGKFINKLADKSTTGLAIAGLALAPFTGGSSLILAMQTLGTVKLIGYGVESIENCFVKK